MNAGEGEAVQALIEKMYMCIKKGQEASNALNNSKSCIIKTISDFEDLDNRLAKKMDDIFNVANKNITKNTNCKIRKVHMRRKKKVGFFQGMLNGTVKVIKTIDDDMENSDENYDMLNKQLGIDNPITRRLEGVINGFGKFGWGTVKGVAFTAKTIYDIGELDGKFIGNKLGIYNPFKMLQETDSKLQHHMLIL